MMLRHAWQTKSLDELVSFSSGGTPRKSNSQYWGGEFPWITAKDLKKPVLFDSQDHLTKEGAAKAKVTGKDSLLILVRGMTLFKDVPVCLVGREMAFNQDIKALAVHNNVDPRYLQIYLVSMKNALLKFVDSAGHGTGRMNMDMLRDFPVQFPPFPEQKAIADLLSTWDEAIEKTERLIQAKEKRFKWLLRELISESRNMQKDAKWKKVTFKHIFKPNNRKNTSNEDLPVLSVTTNGILFQSEYFKKEVASSDKVSYLIVEQGDFVMSGLNFWMGSVDFQTICEAGIVSPAYKVFKLIKGSCFPEYLHHFIRSSEMIKILDRSSVQGASIVRRNLDTDALSNSYINLPCESLQIEIAETLSAAQHEIDLLKKLADKYKTQKRGLMQKMLTGEWRVKPEIVNQYMEA